ncbi:MAG: class I SAM-dependent methyltransferase [Dehalococcoidia bacterium]
MTPLAAVQEQYLAYPYPRRDPADERKQLRKPFLGVLAVVNHVFWDGRRRFDAGFRALDAGCGTGDVTIFMAEHLRDSGAQVVALDFSAASLAIARERAAVRKLTNIEFVEAAVEDVGSLGLAPFDYIVSPGVLHHLASPLSGLTALRSVLKPDGGLGIMVYGQYGRTAIYQLQELLRLLAPGDRPAPQRLAVTKRLLQGLRPTHWATLGKESWEREATVHGDAGMFDMFLHAQDRAYTVPQVYEWLEQASLQLVRFDAPKAYEPSSYQTGLELGHLCERERQAAAELLSSRMHTHTFFAAHADQPVPTPPSRDDEDAAPVWLNPEIVEELPERAGGGQTLRVNFGNGQIEATIKLTGPILSFLRQIDGETPQGTITANVVSAFPAVREQKLRNQCREAVEALCEANALALQHARRAA